MELTVLNNINTVLLGQGFTVGYAFFGIPITMIMFQSMGERMNKFYTIVIKKYRSCRGRKRTEVSEFDLILASGSTSAGAISLLKISCSILFGCYIDAKFSISYPRLAFLSSFGC